MNNLTAEYCEHVFTCWSACRTRAERTQVIMQAVEHTGLSKGTIYRNCIEGRSNRKKRTLSKADQERISECRVVAESVFRFAQLNSHDHSTCSIFRAFTHLQKCGQIPAHFTYDRINRAINDLNLHNEARPIRCRHAKENALDMAQCDFTVSRHGLYIQGQELRVCEAKTTKTNSKDRKKLHCGAMVDDATGVVYAEYFISEGEDMASVHNFLLKGFSRKPEDAEYPNDMLYQGIPKTIYVDNGSSWMTLITERGLAKMGIKRIAGGFEKDSKGRTLKKRNKTGRGKVERFFRTLKDVFEMENLQLDLGIGYKLNLSDLNRLLWNWLEVYNQQHHRDTKNESKWNFFRPSLEKAVYPPDDALAYFTRQITRRVANGEINVGKGVICVAPQDVDDGSEVEVIWCHGKHYIFNPITFERTPLMYVLGTKIQTPKIELAQEADTTILSGHHINLRLDIELKKLTHDQLSIHSAEIEAIWEVLKPWRSEGRSIAEIKTKADELVRLLQNSLPSNVINPYLNTGT